MGGSRGGRLSYVLSLHICDTTNRVFHQVSILLGLFYFLLEQRLRQAVVSIHL